MKCPNCGKSVGRKQYCPNCGEKIVRHFKYKKKETGGQVFRTIVIILMTILAVACALTLLIVATLDVDAILADMMNSMEWIIINIFTAFLPLIILVLIVAVGWVASLVFEVLGLIITALSLIKSKGGQKVYLLILVGVFIVLGVLSVIIGQNIMNENAAVTILPLLS